MEDYWRPLFENEGKYNEEAQCNQAVAKSWMKYKKPTQFLATNNSA